ncbi:MAG: hypothetical protein Q9168_004109 [Polycauliona sp. 1 TL-2023]
MADKMDNATAVAILTSQLQDLDDLESPHHDKGLLTDEHLALSLYREELRHRATSLGHHQIGTLFAQPPNGHRNPPELALHATSILPTQIPLPHVLTENPAGANDHSAVQIVNEAPAESAAQDIPTVIPQDLDQRNITVETDDPIPPDSKEDGLPPSPTRLHNVIQDDCTRVPLDDGSPKPARISHPGKRRRPEHTEDHGENPNPSKARR